MDTAQEAYKIAFSNHQMTHLILQYVEDLEAKVKIQHIHAKTKMFLMDAALAVVRTR